MGIESTLSRAEAVEAKGKRPDEVGEGERTGDLIYEAVFQYLS